MNSFIFRCSSITIIKKRKLRKQEHTVHPKILITIVSVQLTALKIYLCHLIK